MRKFSKRLRETREWAGLTQQDLGEMIGLSGHWATVKISQYELGVYVPKLTTVVRLAKVLGVEVGELL